MDKGKEAAYQKFVAISCVKNEYDIIEAFVRHTLAYVDNLIILENGSTDGTGRILQNLSRNDGLPIEIIEDPSPGYWQWKRMTRLMTDFAIGKYDADWIICLDADEFLDSPSPLQFRRSLSSTSGPASVEWRTYIPHIEDDQSELNPVVRMRHRLNKEAQQWCKVMVPRAIAIQEGAEFGQGDHFIAIKGKTLEMTPIKNATLAHFPIRSPQQWATKIALGVLQHEALFQKEIGWGFHIIQYWETLKEDSQKIFDSYKEAAIRYCVPPSVTVDVGQPVIDPVKYKGGPMTCTPFMGNSDFLLRNVLKYAEALAKSYAHLNRDHEVLLSEYRALKTTIKDNPLPYMLPASSSGDCAESGRAEQLAQDIDSKASMDGRRVVLFLTHIMDKEILQESSRLSHAIASSGIGAYRVLFDESQGSVPIQLGSNQYVFNSTNLEQLGYPLSQGPKIVPGSGHYPILLFFKDFPNYDYYWVIEYDVRFTGDWNTLFNYYENDDADLITAHIRNYEDEPDWPWWKLKHPKKIIETQHRLRSFNPIYRISRSALAYIDKMHREGWVGHGEVFLPTLLFHGGYRILDFGGNGPYVREGDKGRFYTEEDTPSVPLRKNLEGSLVEGTHRFRPIFTEVGPLKDKIYHPIKSKIWVEFETKIANIDQELAKRSTMINEDKRLLTEAEERLNAIHNSKLWRLSIIFAKLFRVLAPSESSRYKAIRMVVKPIAKTFFKMR